MATQMPVADSAQLSRNAQTIDMLTSQLARATERARVAETRAMEAESQLRRVQVAVRAFKQRQLEAKRASGMRQSAQTTEPENSGLYRSWAAEDPSLDDRFSDYFESSFEPDDSRKWMLEEL